MIPLCRRVELGSAVMLPSLMLGVLLLLTAGGPVSADQVFTPDRMRPDNRVFPITELRMVREPGNLHYVQTNDGEFILSDYWWREVKVGERRFSARPVAPGAPPVPVPAPASQPVVGLKKVFVEIVAGKGYQFFGKEKIRPVSFTLIEDLPRNVPIRYGNARGTLVAVFDGYHVDMGLEQAARVTPGYNGVVQDLGDGQGLQDVAISVYWEENERGDALVYPENVDTGADLDNWGLTVKAKVQTRKQPAPAPAPSQDAPVAAPEAAPQAAPEVAPQAEGAAPAEPAAPATAPEASQP